VQHSRRNKLAALQKGSIVAAGRRWHWRRFKFAYRHGKSADFFFD
jgi:hypothetical protein